MIVPPQGFVQLDQGPVCLMLRATYKAQLMAQGIDRPDALYRDHAGTGHAGRGSVPVIPLSGRADERMVIRKYLRGGLVRFFNPDLYVGRQRPFNELALTVDAAAAGIPTVTILAALSVRVLGPLYRLYLVSRELPECCDLPAWFQTGPVTPETTAVLARRAADTIRHMHDRGFYHGDLNLKNILVRRDDLQQLFIIDWDKSARAGRVLGMDDRHLNVLRFCRSAEKCRQRGIAVPDSFTSLFLEHYWQNPDLARLSRRTLAQVVKRRKLSWRILK